MDMLTDQAQIFDKKRRAIDSKLLQNVADHSSSSSQRIIEHQDNEIDLEPIIEYAQQPLLPLSKACSPLVNIIQNLMIYVQLALDRTSETPPDGLTIDESAAIRLYTMEWKHSHQSLYFILNQTLKSNDRQLLKPFHKYLKLFLTALVKLPCVPPLTIWRGVTKDISQDFHPGKSLIWWSFMSCTTELTVLENNIYLGRNGNRTLFSIESINCRTIRDHSEYKTEDEVLLLPGTQLIVQSQFMPADDLHIIHLKQIRPKDILLEVPFEGGHLYPKEKREWYKKKRLIIPLCMLIVTSIVIGCVLGIRARNERNKDLKINWIGIGYPWAHLCDFNGNNISNVTTVGSECGPRCLSDRKCTHFTWVNISGGICFMKGGNVTKEDAFRTNDPSMICGIQYFRDYIRINRTIDWKGNDWAFSCEFEGNDLLNIPSISAECGEICWNNAECTHFTWTKYDGGTCYLKQGNITKEDALTTNDEHMACGIKPSI